MHYQRHVKDHMDRHHKEVAEYLAADHQAQPQARIILSGQDEIIANLRQYLLNRTGHGGLAAVGMQETLDAANAGRIHRLIMHRDLTYPGWHCPGCGHLGADERWVCPVCSYITTAAELGEALVSRALQTDALNQTT